VRACFLIHEPGRSGGSATIRAYADALSEREGWEVDVAVTNPRAAREELPDRDYDVAIATWWATAGALWEVRARRRLVFLQSIESRFYEERHFFERFAAEQVLSLPVGYIVVAGWMRDVLAELRPDAPATVVTNGIDKDVFAPRAAAPAAGPLRVLVEGQPSLWFKGVQDAVAAVRAMSEPAELTVVAPDPGAAGELGGARVIGGLDAPGMAAAYAEHDVLLKLARVESLGLGPIEAFHVGVPAVLAPYTGHEEYLRHGQNGLVVGHDDLPGTARALDGLARDRERLRALGDGALATAREWPSADDAASAFAVAVEELGAGPEPDADAALRHLQRSQRRWLELSREHARQGDAERHGLEGAVEWHERAVELVGAENEKLHDGLRDADLQIVKAYRELADTRAERAYRAVVAVRRLLRRPKVKRSRGR
jgi:glycosyltransferase involved in cell wall biosynthesis